MKTSNWWYVFFFVLGGIAMVAVPKMLFVKATAQSPAAANQAVGPAINVNGDGSVTELREDGTIVERLNDGRVLQTLKGPTFRVEQLPDGSYVQRPVLTSDGGTVFFGGANAADPETAKLVSEEMQATQAAQNVLAELRSADSAGDKEKLKTQLREKLLAIFELQQKRRAAEVAKIEERLARLKDTMKKRDTAKDSIVDRRLDVLTGGIDELGWEETFPLGGPNAASSFRTPSVNSYGYPVRPAIEGPPHYVPPKTTVPRPANVPALPIPSAPPAATPAAPADAAPPVVPRVGTPPPPTRAVVPPSSR